jgi:hypothetical protein
VVAPGDRARPGRPPPAAVPVHHGVGGEQADQAVDVAPADGSKEPGGQFLALDPGGFKPTGGVLAGVTVTPSCGLSGSAWSNWVDSHSTSFTTRAGSAFESSVNSGSDIERLQSDLDQQQGR